MKLFFLLAVSACESDGSWIKAAIGTRSSVRTPSKSHYWSDCVITRLSLNPPLQQQKETLPPSRVLTIPCRDRQLLKEVLPKLPESLKKTQPICSPFLISVSQSVATHSYQLSWETSAWASRSELIFSTSKQFLLHSTCFPPTHFLSH